MGPLSAVVDLQSETHGKVEEFPKRKVHEFLIGYEDLALIHFPDRLKVESLPAVSWGFPVFSKMMKLPFLLPQGQRPCVS